MDPQLTKDGKPYGPERYKVLVRNCYIVAKNCNTSYVDARDKITPAEMTQILSLIKEEDERNKEYLEKMKKDRENKKHYGGR